MSRTGFNSHSKAKGQVSPVMKKMKAILSLIVGLSIGFAILYGVMRLVESQEDEAVSKIKSGNTKTIGTIIKTGANKGSYAVAEYHVHGIGYTRQDGTPSDNIYVGEHYEVFYAEDDPQESRIDFAVPVFLREELTATTTGTVISNDGAKAGFSYEVSGSKYERWQRIKEGVEVKKGGTYPVEYLVKDPRIGILKIGDL